MTTLGVLYPGHAAEDDYPRLAGRIRPPVSAVVVHTSVGENANSIADARATGESDRLLLGTRELRQRLAPGSIDAVLWACTAGSFVFGLEGAREQSRVLAAAADAPATSTSLAFVEALNALGIGRVTVAATYPADEAALFVLFLAEAGIDVIHVGSANIADGSGGALLGPEEILALAVQHDHPDGGAVLLPDTAVRTVDLLERLDEAAGKPVLTANQVTVWAGLRLAGVLRPQVGLGRLFSTEPAVAPASSGGRP